MMGMAKDMDDVFLSIEMGRTEDFKINIYWIEEFLNSSFLWGT
jgi:hypothetical protein